MLLFFIHYFIILSAGIVKQSMRTRNRVGIGYRATVPARQATYSMLAEFDALESILGLLTSLKIGALATVSH